jgi:hypothetical protein
VSYLTLRFVGAFYDFLDATSNLLTVLVCCCSVQTRRRVAACYAVAELAQDGNSNEHRYSVVFTPKSLLFSHGLQKLAL